MVHTSRMGETRAAAGTVLIVRDHSIVVKRHYAVALRAVSPKSRMPCSRSSLAETPAAAS